LTEDLINSLFVFENDVSKCHSKSQIFTENNDTSKSNSGNLELNLVSQNNIAHREEENK
jgi:hypothetical protein